MRRALPEMITLTYGSLNVTIDLDEHEEEILMQAIERDVMKARMHHEWLRCRKDE